MLRPTRQTRPALAGLALLHALGACTLTGDPLDPVVVVAPSDPEPDAGGALAVPDASRADAGESCRTGSELGACEVELAPSSSCDSDRDCGDGTCVARACSPVSCDDGRRNGDEEGVDCGGSCLVVCSVAGCTSDRDCDSNRCVAGQCLAATCDDGRTNQGEVGPDCAGPCPARCADGEPCQLDGDCSVGSFCPGSVRRCTSVSCDDGVVNGDEVGVDCGGSACPGCPIGTACARAVDCLTGVCGDDGTCAEPTCEDAVRNQDETDVDCGGACSACATGQACAAANDCASGVCGAGACPPDVGACCQPPRCDDGVANGGEPVVDCGNAACGPCGLGSPCTASGQCASGLCQQATCALPPCADGVTNGEETDTDCGGSDESCARCGVGLSCNQGSDCASGNCAGGTCHDCADGERNATETAVDCGGACGACPAGEACQSDADCQSGACQDGRCCGGVGADCTRCARRLSGAINCGTNGPAAAPQCNAFLDCLAANVAACPVRHAPGCSEDPGGACNHLAFGGNGGPGVGLADAILGTAQCEF